MDVYFAQWLTLIIVFTFAVLSPGPDFVIAVRNSLLYSRRVGIMTAFGFGAGVLLHVTYTLLGIAALIEQSVIIFNSLKWIGALYLIYIGFMALRSRGSASKIMAQIEQDGQADPCQTCPSKTLTSWQAFRTGFLTNALNPKASLFFLAIFSQIINPATPLTWQIAYGLTCSAMVTIWFSLVAVVLNHPPIRNRFLKWSKWIDRICGGLMVALGIKIALTSK